MAPSKIMLIRHGEKPTGGGSVLGVDRHGRHSETDLSVRGWQRAGALARFFLPRAGPRDAPLDTPTKLYAADPSPAGRSKRSKHTLDPLAALAGLTIDTRFDVDQVAELSASVASDPGVVLIAWEHHRIAQIVTQLSGGALEGPHWAGDRFDVVLVIDPAPHWHLEQTFQLLLAGDTDRPLA